jgi:HEAT repeat protein
MQDRWARVILAVFGIAALGALVVAPWRSRVPLEAGHQGQPSRDESTRLEGNRPQDRALVDQTGTNAIANLLRRVCDGEILPAEAVCQMKPLGASVFPALVSAFQDPNEDVRWVAAEAVVALRNDAQPRANMVLPGLTELLRDPSLDVRFATLMALAAVGPEAAPAVPGLIGVLEGPDTGADDRTVYLRQKAAQVLGRLGPTARQAIPALTQALKDPCWYLRQEAALALWEITRQFDPSIPLLSQLLADNDPTVGQTAALALSQIAAKTNLSPTLLARIEAAKLKRLTVARATSPGLPE